MKITRTAIRVLLPAGALLAAALSGCNNAPASLPATAHVTPPQSAAQVATEEQMRLEHNARKNQ